MSLSQGHKARSTCAPACRLQPVFERSHRLVDCCCHCFEWRLGEHAGRVHAAAPLWVQDDLQRKGTAARRARGMSSVPLLLTGCTANGMKAGAAALGHCERAPQPQPALGTPCSTLRSVCGSPAASTGPPPLHTRCWFPCGSWAARCRGRVAMANVRARQTTVMRGSGQLRGHRIHENPPPPRCSPPYDQAPVGQQLYHEGTQQSCCRCWHRLWAHLQGSM